MIVTLTGANDFLRSREQKRLVTAFVDEYTDMGLERLDGDESEFERLQESIQSLPFLTARKFVVLREPSKKKNFAEKITDILQSIPDTTDVLIVEPKLDKRLSYYKTLKKQTDFREYTELDANGLSRWAVEYAKDKGGTLSMSGAQFLVDRIGVNQQMLQNEVDKLISYDPKITIETIKLLTERLPQGTVFELLDAVFSGDLSRTLTLYKEQRALRVEPQAIVAMLAWQLNILAIIKTASITSPEEIARESKIHPFVVRKSLGVVRAITLERLKQMIHDLLLLDIDLKRVSIDADEALQFYLVKCCS
jgi:DNA polymerase-3 subunit delta